MSVYRTVGPLVLHYRLVCIRPGRKPKLFFSEVKAHTVHVFCVSVSGDRAIMELYRICHSSIVSFLIAVWLSNSAFHFITKTHPCIIQRLF